MTAVLPMSGGTVGGVLDDFFSFSVSAALSLWPRSRSRWRSSLWRHRVRRQSQTEQRMPDIDCLWMAMAMEMVVGHRPSVDEEGPTIQ